MWIIKSKKRLKQFGNGYATFGAIIFIISFIGLFSKVSFLIVSNMIMGVWFVVHGILMIIGKGFKVEE